MNKIEILAKVFNRIGTKKHMGVSSLSQNKKIFIRNYIYYEEDWKVVVIYGQKD